MPFWSNKAASWANAAIEPKRPYKFVVPIPIIMPKPNSAASVEWFSKNFTTDGAISTLDAHRGEVEFPVVSCTKPGFKTEAYKTVNGIGGYARKREGQPSVYTFTPVILEIIDTVSHDLESTITALLYARGQLKNVASLKNHPDAGRLIAFGNGTPAVTEAGNCGVRVQTNLDIYETNADTMFLADNPAAPISAGSTFPKVRTLRLNNSCLVGVEFGMLDYRAEQLSTVRLTIDYDSFDYMMMPQGLPQTEVLPEGATPRETRELVRQQLQRREQQHPGAGLESTDSGGTPVGVPPVPFVPVAF